MCVLIPLNNLLHKFRIAQEFILADPGVGVGVGVARLLHPGSATAYLGGLLPRHPLSTNGLCRTFQLLRDRPLPGGKGLVVGVGRGGGGGRGMSGVRAVTGLGQDRSHVTRVFP